MASSHHLASSQEQPDEDTPTGALGPPASASMALLPTSAESSFHSARSSSTQPAAAAANERSRAYTETDTQTLRPVEGTMPPALQVTAASTPSAPGSPEHLDGASTADAVAPASAASGSAGGANLLIDVHPVRIT